MPEQRAMLSFGLQLCCCVYGSSIIYGIAKQNSNDTWLGARLNVVLLLFYIRALYGYTLHEWISLVFLLSLLF